jgi:shikimate kinase
MDKKTPRNIILIGFSFTGKTRVGQEVARRLGWGFVDSDDEIVALAGKGIPEIFAQDGEERFRELERRVLETLCANESLVIATGGGAIVDPKNRELLAQSGVVICLEAKPQTIYQRLLAAQKANSVVRPLLAGDDPLKRIESLKMFRQPFYAMADWSVHTDSLDINEVCDEVIRGWSQVSRRWDQERRHITLFPPPTVAARESDAPYCEPSDAAFTVTTTTESYPVFIGWGLLDELGDRMRHAGLGDFAHIVSDEAVFSHYGARASQSLGRAGFSVEVL